MPLYCQTRQIVLSNLSNNVNDKVRQCFLSLHYLYVEDSTYTIYTSPTNTYDQARLYTTHDYLAFRVRACQDAFIVFSNLRDNFRRTSIEVKLGDGGPNTTTVIALRNSTPVFNQRYTTPNVINCGTFRSFWAFWAGNEFKIGQGRIDHNRSQVIATVPNIGWLAIREAAMTSEGQRGNAEWQIEKDAGLAFVSTDHKGVHDYRMWARYDEAVVFSFRGKYDANIIISNMLKEINYMAFEIVIGARSGTLVELRRGSRGQLLHKERVNKLLSNKDTRPFWCSWKKLQFETARLFECGRGTFVGEKVFFSKLVQGTAYELGWVSFATGGNFRGQYFVNQNIDDVMTFATRPNRGYDQAWLVTYRPFFAFAIASCESAKIGLVLQYSDQGPTDVVDVVIGEVQDRIKYTTISYKGRVFRAYTPKVVRCRYVFAFWLMWSGSELRVGRGDIGVGEILKANITGVNLDAARSVALTSGAQWGRWFVKKSYGNLS